MNNLFYTISSCILLLLNTTGRYTQTFRFPISYEAILQKQCYTSSSRTIFGAFSIVLAMATLCFSPPLNLNPRSPTFVSYAEIYKYRGLQRCIVSGDNS